MDLGTQNFLVDDEYNIVAIIDWEMAQTAPWDANYYQWPFPPSADEHEDSIALGDPTHPAHENVTKICHLQEVYRRKFAQAEAKLKDGGTPLLVSIADILDTNASKAYFMMERHGADSETWDRIFAYALVKMAFGYDDQGVEAYLDRKEEEMKRQTKN
jgi:aminoglycoside phosphotransferase (APT) family kinase protein